MKTSLIASIVGVCLCAMLAVPQFAVAADKPVVRTSAQPCLHGLPIWYAEKAGWLKDAPFSSEFMLFASGALRPKLWPQTSGMWAPWAPYPR